MNGLHLGLKVIADTSETFNGWNVRQSWKKEDEKWLELVNQDANSSYSFPKLGQSVYLNDETRSLQKPVICQDVFWASDGTSFVTVHDDYGIRQYLVPEYGANDVRKDLVPFTRVYKNQSIVTSKVHPNYSLFNGSENFNFILLSHRDMPLQLYPLSSEANEFTSMRSFDVTNPINERFQVPHAIDFDGVDQFLAGFDRNRVSLYDVDRSEPVWTVQASKRQCGASFHRQIVSCFDQQDNQQCVEGRTRYFGTYKNELYAVDQRKNDTPLQYRSDSGSGFIQVLRSFNGTYLYGVKRNSSIIDIIDVRQTHQKVNELELPYKIGTQKLKASLSASAGLTIGTGNGSIMNWSSDLVEFGGIERTRARIVNSDVQRLPGEYAQLQPSTSYGSSRVNLVKESPADPSLMVLSFSPDKFCEGSATAQSGLSLVCHTTM